MAENVDNLVLEQLKLIRDDLRSVNEKVDDLQTGQQALQGMLFALSGYMRGIDERVEHIEAKLGIET